MGRWRALGRRRGRSGKFIRVDLFLSYFGCLGLETGIGIIYGFSFDWVDLE